MGLSLAQGPEVEMKIQLTLVVVSLTSPVKRLMVFQFDSFEDTASSYTCPGLPLTWLFYL